MVTVEMVAKMAGVSRGTVDRVLHHRGEVKSETAERVRQAMRELDFQPNTLGRAFSIAKKRNRIGIFLSAREPDFQEQIKQGIEDGVAYAQQLGHMICELKTIGSRQDPLKDRPVGRASSPLPANGSSGNRSGSQAASVFR